MRRLILLLMCGVALGQVPSPQVPLTGTIGSGGIFPLLNSGTISMTDANHTMTYLETTAHFLSVTSSVSLTSTRNIVAPNIFGFCFNVENLTAGGQGIQIIGTTGTGVNIPYGSSILVCYDGTNYIASGLASSAPAISNILQAANNCAVAGTVYSPSANGGTGGCVAPLLLSPTANQVLTSAGYALVVNSTPTVPNSAITFSDQHHYNGWNIGSGVEAQNHSYFQDCVNSTQGIQQCLSVYNVGLSPGDHAYNYGYSAYHGGAYDGAAEGLTGITHQMHQVGVMQATITQSGIATGATSITTGSISCTLAAAGCAAPIGYFPNQVAQGELLLDKSQVGQTCAITGYNAYGALTANAMSYTVSGCTIPTSTAIANITSCSSAGNGQSPQLATCTISPISGTFVAGHNIYLAGQIRDSSILASISGTTITFLSMDTLSLLNANPPAIFQDGPGSTAFIGAGTISTWPIAFMVLGYDGTNLYFSNPTHGSANGSGGGGNVIPPVNQFWPAGNGANHASRNGGTGVVTLSRSVGNEATGPFNAYTVGSTIVLSGWSDSSYNGTFVVTSNTFDQYNDSLTYNQAGATSTATYPGSISSANNTITMYPAALVTGSTNGVGPITLLPNNVPWVNGDVLISAPTNEYEADGIQLYVGQTTTAPSDSQARVIGLRNDGPASQTAMIQAISAATHENNLISAQGSYLCFMCSITRPALNGWGIKFGSSGPAIRYHMIGESFSSIDFDPASSEVIMPSAVDMAGLGNSKCVRTIAGSSSSGQLASATNDCYTQLTGTTGTITGTSLSASCDSGTVTVTGATVGHTVAVSSTTGADVGGAFSLRGSVTAANTITVYVCGTGTPASLAYNVTTY